MAGHSKYKNIMHRKSAQDKIRAKLFSKLSMAITIAARGNPDPETNAALRHAITQGKHQNLGKNIIANAIKKAQSGPSDADDPVFYECKGSDGAFMIIETYVSAHKQIQSIVRKVLNKSGWQLLDNNSILYNFNKVYIFEYANIPENQQELLIDKSIEFGATDIECQEGVHYITCDPASFGNMKELLHEAFGPFDNYGLHFIPYNTVNMSEENIEIFHNMCANLDAIPEVLNIFSNLGLQS